MNKLGGYFLAACFVVYVATSLLQVEGAFLPHKKSNALQTALQALQSKALQRNSDISGSRQKRYTDYQERASAFCTGLCMYEERKSYSDCFDICNYY